jgi:hypothetical protein
MRFFRGRFAALLERMICFPVAMVAFSIAQPTHIFDANDI